MTSSVESRSDVELEHHVGVIGPGEPGRTSSTFNAVHKLSDAGYLSYKAAVDELRAWATSDAYLLIRYSYQSLRQTMRRCAILYSQTPKPDDPYNVKLAINADFLSLLSHSRLYLDHVETQLKRAKHNRKDEEFAEFKRITAHEYDSVFAYRFCYRLRNYALHCGFPVTGFNATSGFIKGTQEQEHSFEATFDTKFLLENFSEWGAQLKAELESMSERIEIMQIAEEFVAALERVHHQMLVLYLPRLQAAAKIVQVVADYATDVNGRPYIFSLPPEGAIETPVTSLSLTIAEIPLDLIATVERIAHMNGKK